MQKQNLHIGYIYISPLVRYSKAVSSLYDCPQFAADKEVTEPGIHSGKVEVIISKVSRSVSSLGEPLRNIWVTDDHEYVPFVVKVQQSLVHD